MSCDEFELQVDAFVDGALDPELARQFELHLSTCVACADLVKRVRRLREVVGKELRSLSAPEHLRAVVAERLRATPVASRWVAWRVGAALAAGFTLGVIGGWQLAVRQPANRVDAALSEAVVSAHIRALQPNHLTDVASSDHHTVKPWFAGKLDFAPPVPELGAEGYPLIGGRLDVLGQHTVAALVYGRGGHMISLFLWPAESAFVAPIVSDHRGFGVIHGAAGAMNYWIVSDLDRGELAQFADLAAQEISAGSASR